MITYLLCVAGFVWGISSGHWIIGTVCLLLVIGAHAQVRSR